jgi:transposase
MPAQKLLAVQLYISGLSLRRIGALLGVSTPTVLRWVRRFAAEHAARPEPAGGAVVIGLDEMWHSLKKSRRGSGSGRLFVEIRGDWLTGSAAVVTGAPSAACSTG